MSVEDDVPLLLVGLSHNYSIILTWEDRLIIYLGRYLCTQPQAL